MTVELMEVLAVAVARLLPLPPPAAPLLLLGVAVVLGHSVLLALALPHTVVVAEVETERVALLDRVMVAEWEGEALTLLLAVVEAVLVGHTVCEAVAEWEALAAALAELVAQPLLVPVPGRREVEMVAVAESEGVKVEEAEVDPVAEGVRLAVSVGVLEAVLVTAGLLMLGVEDVLGVELTEEVPVLVVVELAVLEEDTVKDMVELREPEEVHVAE